MKKILTLMVVMFYVTAMYAMELTLTPGMLPEKMVLLEKASYHRLILKGTATSMDLISLHSLPPTVETLDMSELKIKGGVIAKGDWFGQSSFKEGEIPAYMLFSTNVKSVKLPVGPLIIGRGAFASTPLAEISLSDVKELGEGAFQNCAKLRKADFTAGSFNVIRQHTFSGCTDLSEVSLPASITKIDGYAFEKSGIIKMVLPAVRSIGKYAFAFCKELEEISFPVGCRMGEGAFYGAGNIEKMSGTAANLPPLFATASNLSDVMIIKSEEIEEGSFAGSKVAAIGLGKDVRKIGPYAFQSMPELRKVVVSACDFIPEADPTSFEGNDVSRIALYVKKGEKERWRSAPVWCDFHITEGESGVDEINGSQSLTVVRRQGDKIVISSSKGVKRVDLYSLDGMFLLSRTPDTETIEIDYPAGHEVVMVRVESGESVKVVKLTK
ncbi:MAG: leucine-rich repeat domain-containing protein [Muribaculaceae bacterium]|nr:leucine-rich repeat domain-containing protein [Muribaculaceae bacterium]